MTSDGSTQPGGSILIMGTKLDPKMVSPDDGQTGIKPGLLVYQTGTFPDPEVTLCTALYGSSMQDDANIYVVCSNPGHPTFTKDYDLDTAFAAADDTDHTDTFTVHRLHIGDCFWGKGSSLSLNESDIVACGSSGTVIQYTGDTADKWNVHSFEVLPGTWSSCTWVKLRYIGRLSADSA